MLAHQEDELQQFGEDIVKELLDLPGDAYPYIKGPDFNRVHSAGKRYDVRNEELLKIITQLKDIEQIHNSRVQRIKALQEKKREEHRSKRRELLSKIKSIRVYQ